MDSAIIQTRSSIFWVVAGIASSTLFFVFGVFIGNALPRANMFAQDTLSSWVTSAATVVITVLTFILAVETWRLRAAQTQQILNLHRESIQPSVSLALNNNAAGIHFMDAVVKNTGKGIAKNLRFKFLNQNGSLPTANDEPIIKVFKKLAMIEHGVDSLGVGQELSSFVFSFLQLSNEIGQDIFSPYLNILISYEDVEGNRYTNSFSMNFIQFKGMSKLGNGPAEIISSEIKMLRKALEKVSGSNQRLGVDVYSARDRGIEAEEHRLWIEQQIRAQENRNDQTNGDEDAN